MGLDLTESDLNFIRDAIYDITNNFEFSDEKILEYYDMLPMHIKLEILKWGANDTPTREIMYEWFSNNIT